MKVISSSSWLLLTLVLGLNLTEAPARADDQKNDGKTDQAQTIKISNYLNQILSPKELSTPVCYTCNPDSDSTLLFSNDPLNLDTNQICKHSNGQCKTLTPQNICKDVEKKLEDFDTSGNYPIENDEKNQNKRFESKDLRKRIFGYSNNKFLKIRESTEFQIRCCQQNEKCRSNLKRTELYILIGLGSHAFIAEYNKNTAMEVSEATLLHCKSNACIDQILFHEFAHACQFAKNNFDTALSFCDSSIKLARDDLKINFGVTAAECITLKLNSAALAHSVKDGGNVCKGSWLQESFANALFIDQWHKPSSFNRMCWNNLEQVSDPNHPPFAALGCIMNQSPFRDSLCGKNEGCKP